MLPLVSKYIVHSKTNYFKRFIEPYKIELKPTEWCYIAGLIDTDGSICSYRWGKTKNFQKYRIEIDITNTSLKLINWLKNKIPHHQIHWSPSRRKQKCWIFTIYNLGAVYYTLLNIVDRLVLKQKLGLLALQFCYYKILYYHTTSEEIHAMYDNFYTKMRELNRIKYGFSRKEYSGYYDKCNKDEFLAYLSGVIDGDGSLVLSKTGNLYLTIGTKNKEYAEWLKEHIFGSKLYYTFNTKGNIIYYVVLNCKGAILELLYKIKDYLVIKKDIALKILHSFS